MPRKSKCKQSVATDKSVTNDVSHVSPPKPFEENQADVAPVATEPASADLLPSDLVKGDLVRLHSLVSAAHLNGLSGKVTQLQGDRAHVDLGLSHGSKSIGVKNLEASSSCAQSQGAATKDSVLSSPSDGKGAAAGGLLGVSPLCEGALVEADGLVSAAYINGLCGKISHLQGDRAHVDFGMPFGTKSIGINNLSLTSTQMQTVWQEAQLSLEKHPIARDLPKLSGVDAERLFGFSHGSMPSGMCVCLPEGRWACGFDYITSGCHLLGTSVNGIPKSVLMGQITINLRDPTDMVVLEGLDFQMPAGSNAVFVMQGIVHIRGCTITSRGPGVGVGGGQFRASLVMVNSKIQNCGEGGIVAGGEQSTCELTNCSFVGNQAGGVEVRQGASVVARRSEFRGNGNQAILAWQKPGSVLAIECTCFDHAKDSAILIADGGNANLKRVHIARTGMAGVAVENADVSLEKCVCEDGLQGLLVQSGRCNVVARDCTFRKNRHHGVFIGYDAIGHVNLSTSTMADNKSRGLENCGRRKVLTLEISDNIIQGNGQDGIVGDFMSTRARKLAQNVPITELLGKDEYAKISANLRREQGLAEHFPGEEGLSRMRSEKARKEAGLSHGLPQCAACGKVEGKDKKFSFCTCRGVRYCNSSCQKSHWKEHKLQCSGKIAKCPSFKDPSKDVRDSKPGEPFIAFPQDLIDR